MPENVTHISDLRKIFQADKEVAALICDISQLMTRTSQAAWVEIFQLDRRLNRLFRWNEEGASKKTDFLHRQDPLVALAEREKKMLGAAEWSGLPVPEGRPEFIRDMQYFAPLFLSGELVGAFALGPCQVNDADVFEKLKDIHGVLALLLENLRLRTLNIEDPKTGLRSHDYFSLRLIDEIERSHRYERMLSLMVLRIENLSQYLKEVPALLAERIRRQLAAILMENTRRSNVISQFVNDPDVFQILMPEIPTETANQLGQHLGEKIAAAQIEGLSRPLHAYWGVATFPHDAPSRELLAAKALANLNDVSARVPRDATEAHPGAAPKKGIPDFAQELDVRNPQMIQILETAFRIADSRSTVLITGETGVGKEVLAEFVHKHSSRVEKPLVKVNCGALPESLLESELFGHEKGSFTGAESRRVGRFELANGGTIFLDEIGELTPMAQVKLLRIIEGKTFYRLGGTQPISTDVRIVAATNRDLTDEVQKGNFREDLFYRLNVITFLIPPLRERREDIPLLVARFMRAFNEENKSDISVIHPEAMDILYSYEWPGNIRELKNAIERAMILVGSEKKIVARYLPPSVLKGAQEFKEKNKNNGYVPASMTHVSLPSVGNSESVRFPDLNERQRQVIEFLRVHNFISNQQYVSMMNVSRRTCVRDLNELIDKRLVVREGKKKSCVYRLADGV